jgi:hypothetical protein
MLIEVILEEDIWVSEIRNVVRVLGKEMRPKM